MYKNQLQELAQRSCFNLPSYTCIREGPDHAPRFKATVNFNGETFESTGFFTTLRQAEHSAAEVALAALSTRGPSHSLTARILDETGVYKNLLQEIAQRVGAPLPSYTTTRSGLGHPPIFTGTVEIAGIIFTGEPAKNKKQAEKNSAMAAWSSLKQLSQQQDASSASAGMESNSGEEQEQVTLARALLCYRRKEMAQNPDGVPFPRLFPFRPPDKRPLLRPPPPSGSKILPFLHQRPTKMSTSLLPEIVAAAAAKFPTAAAPPYVPIRHCRPFLGVTVRTAVPVFSAPPLPLNSSSAAAAASYHQTQAHPHSLPVKCASRPAPPPPVQLRQPSVPFVPVQVKPPALVAAPPARPPAAAEFVPPPPSQKTTEEEQQPQVATQEMNCCTAGGASAEEIASAEELSAVDAAGAATVAESLKELEL